MHPPKIQVEFKFACLYRLNCTKKKQKNKKETALDIKYGNGLCFRVASGSAGPHGSFSGLLFSLFLGVSGSAVYYV